MQMLDDSLFDFLHMEIVNLLVELDVSNLFNLFKFKFYNLN